MLRSSLGFHTMTLYMSITREDASKLMMDFRAYNSNKKLKMSRIKEKNLFVEYLPTEDYLPTDIKVKFNNKDRGIRWHIHRDVRSYGMFYIIEATLNPKILSGKTNYTTAATYDDMNVALGNFNDESKKISPLLKMHSDYKIIRIDYCINICLDDFMPGYDPELVMNLIKRGDIPPHYKEWQEYDYKAHRRKSKPESFYLKSKSVTINCYSKHMQLLNLSQKNVEKGHNPILQSILDESHDIIRFEVQCKYHKLYDLSKEATKLGDHELNKYKSLLSPLICIKIVSDYYKKVIGKGDWYTLQEAVCIIRSKKYNSQKEKRLLDALSLVNQCRSIAKAKALLQGHELEAFKRTVEDLSCLNINPVTIPREWGIKHIPNLLRSYFLKS